MHSSVSLDSFFSHKHSLVLLVNTLCLQAPLGARRHTPCSIVCLSTIGLAPVVVMRCETKATIFTMPTTLLVFTLLLVVGTAGATPTTPLLGPVELDSNELVLFIENQSALVVKDGRWLCVATEWRTSYQSPPRLRC